MKIVKRLALLGVLLVLPGAGLVACSGPPANPDGDAGSDADAGYEPGDGGDQEVADGDGAGEGDEPIVLRLDAVLPSRGPVQGGTWVNILGAAFVRGIDDSPFDVRDVTQVTFGDNPALDLEVVRDDMISVRTPPNPAGAVAVSVENPNGRVVLDDAFVYYEQVIADGVSPRHLSARGGTPITFTGSGLSGDTILLVGGRPCSSLAVPDSSTVTGLAPPGSPGQADVEVVNRNGRALLFRAVTYHPEPWLEALQPAAGPAGGGTATSASGQGFEAASVLRFATSDAATSFLDAATLQAITPAAPPGPVDVSVVNVTGQHTLAGGFVYLDEAQGALRLLGVAPATGPVAGGVTRLLAGEGFAGGVDQVLFGGNAASGIVVLDDRTMQVQLPPAQAGSVDVSVHTSSGQVTLPAAFRYYTPLQIDALDPATGPVAGGTGFTLTGSGFHTGMAVHFGGVAVSDLQVLDAGRAQGSTPAGTPGPVDVEVRDADSRALLSGGFSYVASPGLVRVEPDSGAQAGGTYVTVYGSGFVPGLRVWFGEREGTVVQLLGDGAFTARTPPAEPGEVTVAVETGAARVELPAGFSYFDPTNDRGGASGGVLQGSFNVTVLDGSWSRYGEPVPEALVMIEQPELSSFTDERGQVTFSGPALVKAVTVTVAKDGYEAVSVVELNAANLTVYLYPNVQEPIDIQPGQMKVADLSGRVFGFKNVPGLPSGPDVSLQARVNLTAWSLYAVPPYGGAPQGQVIEQDGGGYSYTLRLGNYSVYAVYGAYDAGSNEFTPALLGVRRGITLMSEEPLTDQDIILSTPLDQTVPVHLLDPPLAPGEQPASYSVYASLDLGYDGIVYLGSSRSSGTEMLLEHLPQAAGQSFLLVGLASIGGSYPLSYVYRRQEGDLSAGIDVGPFLGFVTIDSPAAGGQLEQERLSWHCDGPAPALAMVLLETSDLVPAILWRVILPGNVNQVQLPPEVLEMLPHGEPLLLLIYTANSPRFRFDRFNYAQLGSSRWTAYSVQYATFTVP